MGNNLVLVFGDIVGRFRVPDPECAKEKEAKGESTEECYTEVEVRKQEKEENHVLEYSLIGAFVLILAVSALCLIKAFSGSKAKPKKK